MTERQKLQKKLASFRKTFNQVFDEVSDSDLNDDLFWEGYKDFEMGMRLMVRRLEYLESLEN